MDYFKAFETFLAGSSSSTNIPPSSFLERRELTIHQWKRLIKLVSTNGFYPLFHLWSTERLHRVPYAIRRSFVRHQKLVLANQLLYFADAGRLASRLSKQGVVHAFFKGPILYDRIFPFRLYRHTGDIDLLVDPKDLSVVCSLLESLGYKAEGNIDAESPPWQVEFFHSQHQLSVDLHIAVSFVQFQNFPLLSRTSIQDLSARMLTRARVYRTRNLSARTLRMEDQFLFLSLQFLISEYCRGAGKLFDLVIFSRLSGLDWKLIQREAQRLAFSSSLAFIMGLGKRFFTITPPRRVLERFPPNLGTRLAARIYRRSVLLRPYSHTHPSQRMLEAEINPYQRFLMFLVSERDASSKTRLFLSYVFRVRKALSWAWTLRP